MCATHACLFPPIPRSTRSCRVYRATSEPYSAAGSTAHIIAANEATFTSWGTCIPVHDHVGGSSQSHSQQLAEVGRRDRYRYADATWGGGGKIIAHIGESNLVGGPILVNMVNYAQFLRFP